MQMANLHRYDLLCDSCESKCQDSVGTKNAGYSLCQAEESALSSRRKEDRLATHERRLRNQQQQSALYKYLSLKTLELALDVRSAATKGPNTPTTQVP